MCEAVVGDPLCKPDQPAIEGVKGCLEEARMMFFLNLFGDGVGPIRLGELKWIERTDEEAASVGPRDRAPVLSHEAEAVQPLLLHQLSRVCERRRHLALQGRYKSQTSRRGRQGGGRNLFAGSSLPRRQRRLCDRAPEPARLRQEADVQTDRPKLQARHSHLPNGGRRRDQLHQGAQRDHPGLGQVRPAAPALRALPILRGG